MDNRLSFARIIGTIGAMHTLVENFPMSILDTVHGATPTTVFMFLLDILEQCNIPVQEIINRLIGKVFGINRKIQGGINTIYETINNLEIDEESDFFIGLERGVKNILMALLASIFSCSAVPVISTKYMDTGKKGMKDKNRAYINTLGETIIIPKNVLDIFGYLDVNPCSNEGKFYYSVEGGDKYYQKVKRTEIISHEGNTVTVPVCDKFSELYLSFGEGHADYVAGYGNYMEDEIEFRITTPVERDIIVVVNFTNSDGLTTDKEFKIPAGQRVSEIFFVTPSNPIGQKEYINSILIKTDTDDSLEKGKELFDTNEKSTYVYLSKNASDSVIKFWKSQGNNSLNNIEWGSPYDCGVKEYTLSEAESNSVDVYEYIEIGEMPDDAVRTNFVPSSPDEDSPEYIVCYQGINPNGLYKTNDMNAFLWYVFNRSTIVPQIEVNKSMWDSRRTAEAMGVVRESSEDWNEWYNSKETPDDELSYSDNSEESPELYPILQLSKEKNAIGVVFPAQRYFKPSATPDDSDLVYDNLRLNASIYRFNYEYLQSIRIFDPKAILFGMFDGLLGGALTALLSIRVNLTRKETETLLSTAIKKYIEAEDAEVEDCYFTFSNEEFDKMLQDMLLARYGAVSYGGEVNKAKVIDAQSYIEKIDDISTSSSIGGEITKINKIVTEVSTIPGSEGTIDYGLNISMDNDWWRRVIWAITYPIVKAIFSPQLVLLILINFHMMGIVSLDDLFGTNQSAIIRLLTNKIFALVRSIISYIKDELVRILLEFFVEVILPTIEEYQLLKLKESLDAWIDLLLEAVSYIPLLSFRRRTTISSIDDVNYADIINEQKTPETTGGC